MKTASRHLAFGLIWLTILFCVCLPTSSRADDDLPEAIRAQAHVALEKVGSGTYRRFGFSVYRVSLWAPDGVWDAAKPYALQLRYTRSVSKETLVDTVADDIRDQNVTDDATLAQWKVVLNTALPDVEDGDTIIGLARPGKESQLFYNGKKTAAISDQAFSRAFFNIWLGDTADEDLRNKLLGKTQ